MVEQVDTEKILYHFAITVAQKAGEFIKSRLGQTGEIKQKGNIYDLVTEVDKLSEKFLCQKINERFPDHWILSEEDCGRRDPYEFMKTHRSGYGWIIDPIDGTTNFIQGIPYFSVSIGVVKDGEPVIGVVYNPITDHLYTAGKSFGAYLNGKLIRVGKQPHLSEIVAATGFHVSDFIPKSNVVQQIDKLAGTIRGVRIFGAASLDLCLVASGKIGAFWHDGLNPWDVASGILILTEAGGKVTNRDGESYKFFHDSLVATNGEVHDEFLEMVKL